METDVAAAPQPVAEPAVRRSWADRVGPDWATAIRYSVVVYLCVRVALLLLGLLVVALIPMQSPVGVPGWPAQPQTGGWHNAVTAWERADSLWFLRIASTGYRLDDSSAAFFPLFPMLVRAVGWLTGGRYLLAGFLVSNLALVSGLVVMFKLTAEELSELVARRSVLYLCVFPTAFFLFSPFSESLFLACAVGAIYAARRDRWWLAGGLGFLAALARSQGVLLLLPLVIIFIRQQGWHPRAWRANPIGLALIPAGLMVYMAYLRRQFNDPLVMISAQKGWDRYSANPIETMQAGVKAVNGCAVRDWNAGVNFCWSEQIVQHPSLATIRDLNWRWALSESNVVELVATLLLIAVGIAAFRYLPLAYSAYLAAGVILPLWSPSAVHPLMSMHRFALVLFPFFIVLALLGKWRPVHGAIIVVSALLLAFFTIQFASWLWVA
jgi:hypothetical protein